MRFTITRQQYPNLWALFTAMFTDAYAAEQQPDASTWHTLHSVSINEISEAETELAKLTPIQFVTLVEAEVTDTFNPEIDAPKAFALSLKHQYQH